MSACVTLSDIPLKDRPYFEESYYYLGLAQAAQGDTAAARDNLQKSAAFNPNYELPGQALTALDSSGG